MYVNPYIEGLIRIKSDEGRMQFLRLDMNENPEGLPRSFFERVIGSLTPEALAMYPETDELIELIHHKINVPIESITLFNGSDDGLKTIFEVFGEPGKALVAVDPSFAMYPIYARMCGMTYTPIGYKADFTISTSSILSAITSGTGIVSLVNPNNPMGNVYKSTDVEKILLRAKEVGALVIIDEAYHYFYDKTFIHLTEKFDNLIVTRTFSKLCSIAGLRIGYAISNKHVSGLLNSARPTYSINVVAIEFAKAILSDSGLIERLITAEREGREYVKEQLQQHEYQFFCEEANFIFIKTRCGEKPVEARLKERKVLVKTYSAEILKGYIRISTGGIQSMRRFLEAFFDADMEEKA